ncbi:hypothetical protein AHF37_00858 [Paragonimus kellicotti]|nr:hypothetical protein AHF37_00858 [Paragonimus kellicotti]
MSTLSSIDSDIGVGDPKAALSLNYQMEVYLTVSASQSGLSVVDQAIELAIQTQTALPCCRLSDLTLPALTRTHTGSVPACGIFPFVLASEARRALDKSGFTTPIVHLKFELFLFGCDE